MSTREALMREIENQPEGIVVEMQQYLAFLLAQRETQRAIKSNGWPKGYFDRTAGAFANEEFERPEQPAMDRRGDW